MSSIPVQTLDDLSDPEGQVALVRVDYNVPLDGNGDVTDDTRIRRSLPTLRELLDRGCSLVLMSHLGRPGGREEPDLSLSPVADRLSALLDRPVQMASDVVGSSARQLTSSLQPRSVVMLENLRFHPGEKQADEEFARSLAGFGDFYVNDAFGACHRAHASISEVPKILRPAVAGRLLEDEYRVLTRVRDNPARPLACLMGGAKLGDKLPVVEHFLTRADRVLIGGAMAYTFVLARGGSVGSSLVDREFESEARRILDNLDDYRAELTLPEDVVITPSANVAGEVDVCPADEIPEDWEGMDIGPATRTRFLEELAGAGMVFWNGPLGVFEMEAFMEGTRAVVEGLTTLEAEVIVGGGDSASAVAQLQRTDDFYHVSTGGGASLQLVSGETLPGIDALDPRS